jgi:methyl-accepting chemotaxis protein
MTQQNAANAEESASASEEMKAQSAQMKTIAGELMSIVGGDLKASAEAPANPQNTVLKKALSLKKFVKKANTGSKDIRPESVIPLGNEDFKNF